MQINTNPRCIMYRSSTQENHFIQVLIEERYTNVSCDIPFSKTSHCIKIKSPQSTVNWKVTFPFHISDSIRQNFFFHKKASKYSTSKQSNTRPYVRIGVEKYTVPIACSLPKKGTKYTSQKVVVKRLQRRVWNMERGGK